MLEWIQGMREHNVNRLNAIENQVHQEDREAVAL
jgi:hypothetical protein